MLPSRIFLSTGTLHIFLVIARLYALIVREIDEFHRSLTNGRFVNMVELLIVIGMNCGALIAALSLSA